jgi:thioredoxin-like negative regulator of GroEL
VIELLLEAERALSFGRVDEAERLYRQVATADPANSIAVVGLARVALEHADDAGAYVLARRALTIDPENEAARRLVTRLDEVMRTRGEAVPGMAVTPTDPAAPVESTEPIAATKPASQAMSPSAAPEPQAPPPVVRRRSLIDRIRGR